VEHANILKYFGLSAGSKYSNVFFFLVVIMVSESSFACVLENYEMQKPHTHLFILIIYGNLQDCGQMASK